MNPAFDVAGLKVAVTGASSGIGEAVARGFAAAGADVALISRSAQKLKALAEALRASHGVQALPVVADLSTADGARGALAEVGAAFTRLDVLVNNAGTNIRKAALQTDEASWHRVLATNLDSAFFCAQGAVPLMDRGGAIVNVSSVGGLVALPTGAAYAASKGAMNQLTRVLALEWAPLGVRVNAVAPWYFPTPLTEGVLSDPDYLKRVLAATPMGRVGALDELVATILFLSAPGSAYITGQVLAVDGGMSVQGMA